MKQVKIQIGRCIHDVLLFLYIIKDFSAKRLSFRIRFPETNTKELIILANGPSLEEDIMNHVVNLKDVDYMAVNLSPLVGYFSVLKPKYLIFADPVFWSKSIPDSIISNLTKVVDILKNDVDWQLTIYMPYVSKKSENYLNTAIQYNNNLTLKYYNNTSDKGGHRCIRFFFYEKNILMPPVQNVLVPSLFIGIKMKYQLIKILGADHSWLDGLVVGNDNILYHKEQHYNHDTYKMKPFFCNSEHTQIFKMHEILSTLSRNFEAYWYIQEYAYLKSVKILNGTSRSYIDAFDRLVPKREN